MRNDEARKARQLQQKFEQFEKLSKLVLTVCALALCFGWLNLILIASVPGYLGVSMLALAEEPISILNLMQPVMILFAAFLSWQLARASWRISDRVAFIVLSVGLAVLAIEEFGAGSHSIWIHRISAYLQTNNPVAVMAPFLVFPLALASTFAPQLLRMPARYSARFVLSGAVYVFGVLILETLSQVISIQYGHQSILYLLTAGTEETFETLGMAGYCVTASMFLRDCYGRLS